MIIKIAYAIAKIIDWISDGYYGCEDSLSSHLEVSESSLKGVLKWAKIYKEDILFVFVSLFCILILIFLGSAILAPILMGGI